MINVTATRKHNGVFATWSWVSQIATRSAFACTIPTINLYVLCMLCKNASHGKARAWQLLTQQLRILWTSLLCDPKGEGLTQKGRPLSERWQEPSPSSAPPPPVGPLERRLAST